MEQILLVTGGYGFVGSPVIRELRKHYTVWVATRKRRDKTDIVVDWMKKPTPALQHRLKNVTSVVHLAARTAKIHEEITPAMASGYIHDNVYMTFNVCAALSEAKLTHFLYVSTLDVYDQRASGRLSEKTATNPSTAYGMSKLLGEYLAEAHFAIRHVPFCVGRLGLVYGPGEESYGKMIPSFIRSAVEGKPLVITGNGRAKRNFIYVDDVARAILLLCRKNATGIYNVASGSPANVLEVAKKIVRLTGGNSRIMTKPVIKPQQDRLLSGAKIARLGFYPNTTFIEGLQKEITYASHL